MSIPKFAIVLLVMRAVSDPITAISRLFSGWVQNCFRKETVESLVISNTFWPTGTVLYVGQPAQVNGFNCGAVRYAAQNLKLSNLSLVGSYDKTTTST
jgi:hypothetical protein